jgi:hippurate hydrolase
MPSTDTLLAESADLLGDAVALRRRLHRRPELGLHLPATQDAVTEALDAVGLDTVRLGERVSSVVGVLEGERPGPTLVLRGDMDALPMPEASGVGFSSEIDGAMHACGHDRHTAMLVGAARLLVPRRAELAGRVLFMFQPGEEGHHGARYMLEEGLLEPGPRPDGSVSPVTGAFALHVVSHLRSGTINLKGGTMMASADRLVIEVRGRGGHASAAHLALDPIPVACEIVGAIQTLVTRRVDVFDPAVVTVAQIVAGTTNNVIPESARLVGTIRAVSERTRALVHERLRGLAEGIAAAHEATATVTIEPGYPVTVNADDYAEFASGVAVELLGDEQVRRMPFPAMGAEDFSYVLQRVPGAMAFLGACPEGVDPHRAAPNHSNRVVYDEGCMTAGMAMYAAVALRHLAPA